MGMQALSEAQFRAATEGGVPDPERVYRRPDGAELWSVAVPMPEGSLEYTLSAILIAGDGSVTVVDPGWALPESFDRLETALDRLGRGIDDIGLIVVTHAHPDHLGAAEILRQKSGARVAMHEREQSSIEHARFAQLSGGVDLARLLADWGVPDDAKDRLSSLVSSTRGGRELPDADELLRDGDRLPLNGIDWEVLWTPGHTPGHICIVDRAERLLLSGDHVLPTLFPGIGIGVDWGLTDADEDPISSNLESLARLAPYDDFDVLPGHGYRFRGLGSRREAAAGHILSRAREVAAADAADPDRSVWQLASGLTWSAGWERLSAGPMLPSALWQTSRYRAFVRAGGLR